MWSGHITMLEWSMGPVEVGKDGELQFNNAFSIPWFTNIMSGITIDMPMPPPGLYAHDVLLGPAWPSGPVSNREISTGLPVVVLIRDTTIFNF